MIRTRMAHGTNQLVVMVLNPEELAKVQGGEIVRMPINDVCPGLPFQLAVGIAYTPDPTAVTRSMLTGKKLLEALAEAKDLPPTIEGINDRDLT